MLIRRFAQLIVGLACFGFAAALMVEAAVGLDPWTVFAQGLSYVTGLTIGWLIVLTGIVVLLLWIPLKQKPGIGTVLNILLIGPALDLGLMILETPEALWQRILMFAAGLVLMAVASGLYIGSHFGTGPRDGLMIGLKSRLGVPIWLGRTAIEVTVLVIGWLLGGNVGFGTLAFALLIGPLCNIALPLLEVKLPAKPTALDIEDAGEDEPLVEHLGERE